MGKHRVYEIAKELGKTNQEVIDILAKNNIQVKSTLSTVDDTVRDLVVKNSARKPVGCSCTATYSEKRAG